MKFFWNSSKWPLLLSLVTGAVSGQPFELTREHVDLRIIEAPAEVHHFGLVIHDSVRRITYDPSETILVVSEEAKLELPPGTPFGNAGDGIWVLPQASDPDKPDILFLGTSAEAFSGFNPARLQLRAMSGPGEFFLWQFDGGFKVRMDTSDGISEADFATIIPGSHSHYSWGFTAPGRYQLAFQVQTTRSGSEEIFTSPETLFTFHVLPLSDLMPFEEWQRIHWPEGAPDSVQAPDADPDRDEIVNLMEYALGLDPKVPSRERLPAMTVVEEAGNKIAVFTFTRPKTASDLIYEIWATADLGGNWQRLEQDVGVIDHGATETVSVRDSAAATASQRFYQLRVRFR